MRENRWVGATRIYEQLVLLSVVDLLHQRMIRQHEFVDDGAVRPDEEWMVDCKVSGVDETVVFDTD